MPVTIEKGRLGGGGQVREETPRERPRDKEEEYRTAICNAAGAKASG